MIKKKRKPRNKNRGFKLKEKRIRKSTTSSSVITRKKSTKNFEK